MDPVIILGGTGGIGAAIARRLHARDVPLHLVARDGDRLAALVAELADGVTFTVGDVRDDAVLATAIAAAAPAGRLGGLVCAVGSIVLKSVKAATAADYRDAFELNALVPAMAMRHAAPHLIAGTGAVVLFSTVAVAQGFTNHAVIASAKGAVEGLTRAAAADLAPHVRVNCIAPSLTRTPLASAFTRNDAMAAAIAKLHPLERLGEADDVAALAAFMLGPDAGWMTGQVIGVDGGRSTLRPKG